MIEVFFGLGGVVTLAGALVVAGVLVAVSASRRPVGRRLAAFADRTGLVCGEDGVVYGAIDGAPVRLEVRQGAEALSVWLSVHGLPADLELRQRRPGDAAGTPTGDAAFDRVARIDVADALAVGRLGPELREWLGVPLSRGWLWLRAGVLVLEVPLEVKAPDLERWLRGLVWCAVALGAEGDDADRMLTRVVRDPDDGVRLQAARVLVLRGHQRGGAALAGAPNLPAWDVLRAIHDRDHRRLGELLADRTVPDEARCDAALGLVHAPEPALTEALARLWRSQPDRMWPWTLAVMSQNGVDAAVAGAIDLLRRGPSSSTWRAKARTQAVLLLGQRGRGQACEDALLGVLDDGRLRRLALRALGDVGTIRVVEHLLPWTERSLFADTHAVALAAVRSIQERRGGGDRGGLSVASPVAGELTLAAPPGGELTIRRTEG